MSSVPELLDARGVAIAPGDTAIYGFGVGRSVAMAEAVVLGEARGRHYEVKGQCTCKREVHDYDTTCRRLPSYCGGHGHWMAPWPCPDTVAYPDSSVNTWPCINEDVEHDGPRCECAPPSPSVSLTPSGRVRLRVVRRSYSSGEKPVVDVAPDRLVVLKHRDTGSPPLPYLPPSPLPTQDEKARPKIEGRIKDYTERLRSPELPDYWQSSGFPEEDMAAYLAFLAKELAEQRRKLKELDEMQ